MASCILRKRRLGARSDFNFILTTLGQIFVYARDEVITWRIECSLKSFKPRIDCEIAQRKPLPYGAALRMRGPSSSQPSIIDLCSRLAISTTSALYFFVLIPMFSYTTPDTYYPM